MYEESLEDTETKKIIKNIDVRSLICIANQLTGFYMMGT